MWIELFWQPPVASCGRREAPHVPQTITQPHPSPTHPTRGATAVRRGEGSRAELSPATVGTFQLGIPGALFRHAGARVHEETRKQRKNVRNSERKATTLAGALSIHMSAKTAPMHLDHYLCFQGRRADGCVWLEMLMLKCYSVHGCGVLSCEKHYWVKINFSFCKATKQQFPFSLPRCQKHLGGCCCFFFTTSDRVCGLKAKEEGPVTIWSRFTKAIFDPIQLSLCLTVA